MSNTRYKRGSWLLVVHCIFVLICSVEGSTASGDTLVSKPSSSGVKPKNYIFPPLLSFFLPGFDQWVEGDYRYATAYSGSALAGIVYSRENRSQLAEDLEGKEGFSEEWQENRLIHGELERKIALGGQITFASGSFSAYHSFRTATKSRRQLGEFTFLPEETPEDILLSPFRFDYIFKSSTYIPLSIAAGFLFLNQASILPDEYVRDSFSGSDLFYSGATSYLAGTHEEALYRGVIMPGIMNSVQSEFWSNSATAFLFAISHLATVDVPLPQFLLGWHLGNVTQNNKWSISESVFIHTWWNVFAFVSIYNTRKKQPERKSTLWLPGIAVNF